MRKWLKDLRDKKELSQKVLAEMLGISQNYYSNIENGERQKDLDLSLVIKLSKIFDVSVEWIIEQERKFEA